MNAIEMINRCFFWQNRDIIPGQQAAQILPNYYPENSDCGRDGYLSRGSDEYIQPEAEVREVLPYGEIAYREESSEDAPRGSSEQA
jgi:hypothetical protein